ncbi:zinc-binding dehydrogenase [Wenjunlia tyrosinilytica]|uniref:Alcohol dehydrogenase-like C-terminal domain-containing protein n=1 Tax=Wenjunlia tyrosinilytica TaxID=1544741 RepID=A0A917ZWE8_9ACTN|nr:zinc-binding dehydrogenase [Wenjunlia tyrosinilytica]GGO98992.1 hypothetical protein GCM10012280_64410 [Wenjunlia tyrosinilytica]
MSSTDEADRLRAELGYDAVVVPGPRPIDEQPAAATPDGIDVLLDTVGGEQLTAAVRAARRGARFVLVGALSGQLSPRRDGGSATRRDRRTPARQPSLDHPEVTEEWTKRFGDWLRSREIAFPHVSAGTIAVVVHGAVPGVATPARPIAEALRNGRPASPMHASPHAAPVADLPPPPRSRTCRSRALLRRHLLTIRQSRR